jgi:hypothetical protein
MKPKFGRTIMKACLLLFGLLKLAPAQAPTGDIAGVVRDPTGAAVVATQVKLVSVASSIERSTRTTAQGDYSFPALLAGEYELSVAQQGFQRIVRVAVVEAGATTTADFGLRLGEVTESVTVDGAVPEMQYDSHSVGGVITRMEIDELPLNGRSFLELAKLEPGVQPPTRGSNNRMFVPVLGAPFGNNGRATRITIDGGSIMAVGNGGSAMGASQEVVQEFQLSTVNFDLSTGLTYAGSANVVTRSGGNVFHGAAFYYFRDHTLSAYPALQRDPVDPDPFFQRQQFGFAIGGPIRRDRLFFFANWERNDQRGVVGTTLDGADFAHFSRVTPTPFVGDQFGLRVDGRITEHETAFIRYSHDGNRAFGPSSLTAPVGTNLYPSDWTRQLVWADQSLLGLTSILHPTLVNDLRFSYFFISSSEVPPQTQDCAGCLGLGAPIISVPEAGLYVGESSYSRQLGRRYQLNDSLAWQWASHRARFGVDWEHNRGGLLNSNNEPATITLFSPNQARQAKIPLPSSFLTLDDILQLPLQSVTVGIGDPRVPQENSGNVRHWNTLRLYFTDTWRLHPRLTVNYGLGWSIDRDLNYDLRKPALLAPILGTDGLGPTRKQWKNFSPTLGFAWTASKDAKTVFRAGAGIYYDYLFAGSDAERAALGPLGLGQQTYQGVGIPALCPGVPALDFRSNPTFFTGADVMMLLPTIRSCLTGRVANSDPSVEAIQLAKAFPSQLGALIPTEYPSPSSQHVNVGVQRQIAPDFVLSADLVYRHFIHVGSAADLNHYNSVLGPVIPKCVGTQVTDPQAICSLGQIYVSQPAGRATYKGLLLRADKRFSHGFQVLGSYAYSSNTGTNGGSGSNLYDRLSNVGPLSTDFTQIANLAGIVQLPRRFDLALNFSYSSAPPFSAFVGGIDFNGDGTVGDLLPGTTVNVFNRGLGRSDLERLIAQFNAVYAGKSDAQGRLIPTLTLPARYSLGDNFHTLDLRLSRSFVFRERWRVSLIGDVFNLYNKPNLTGYSGDLTSPAFGQPTSRATQVFGSGGPRAFQLAMRVGF